MAKAKPAGKPAAKKSSKSKSGAKKRKKKGKGGGAVDDRPIIVKGHALPTAGDDDDDEDYSVIVGGQVEGDPTFSVGDFPFQYNFPAATQPSIVVIEVYLDGERKLEQKVGDSEWRILLHTV